MAKINANYEALYILDPSLSEEQIAALVARFQSVVEAQVRFTANCLCQKEKWR